MKKILLGLTLVFPLQTVAADSVHSWGSWKDGIQPAAGPVVARAIPTTVKAPKINIRPNEAGNVNRIAEATRGATRLATEAEEAERLAAQEAARIAAQEAARAAADERARLAAAEAARLAAEADEAARLAAEEAARLAAEEAARLAAKAEEAARLAAQADEAARLAAEADERARLAERLAAMEEQRRQDIERRLAEINGSSTSLTQTQPAVVSPNPAGRFN